MRKIIIAAVCAVGAVAAASALDVGGGAAFAREYAEAHSYSATDWYGGLYLEGGMRYRFAETWALAAGPRYTYLFDEAPLAYDIDEPGGLLRSEDRTRLLDFLLGINYYF